MKASQVLAMLVRLQAEGKTMAEAAAMIEAAEAASAPKARNVADYFVPNGLAIQRVVATVLGFERDTLHPLLKETQGRLSMETRYSRRSPLLLMSFGSGSNDAKGLVYDGRTNEDGDPIVRKRDKGENVGKLAQALGARNERAEEVVPRKFGARVAETSGEADDATETD